MSQNRILALESFALGFLVLGSLVAPKPASADVGLEVCTAAVKHLESTWDLGVLTDCMDFFFSSEGFDVPEGSFNRVIKLGYRVLELDPRAAPIYTQVAWLLYSKYATWHSTPAQMPDGALKADEAVGLLLKGRKFLGNDPAYQQDASDTIWPLASHYRPEFYEFVIEGYRRVDELIPALKVRVRVRLNLGHIYRERGEREAAIAEYKRVLELEPANPIALKYLKALGA